MSDAWAPPEVSFAALGLTIDQFDALLAENPSLRSFVVGYTAETKLRDHVRAALAGRVTDLGKPDDHDRTAKGDRTLVVDGYRVRLESKSLQTSSVRVADDGSVTATFQCDASDRRAVTLPDGLGTVETTSLLYGEFDIVAVNTFNVTGTWRFAFAANGDLPHSTQRNLTDKQRRHLIRTTVPFTMTAGGQLPAGFTWSLPDLVDRLADAGKLTAHADTGGAADAAAA